MLDGVYLVKAGEIAVEKSRKLKLGGGSFDLNQFMFQTKRLIRQKDEDYPMEWDLLRAHTKRTCHIAPSLGFMLVIVAHNFRSGAITVEPKERAERKKGTRLQKSGDVKKPEAVWIFVINIDQRYCCPGT